MRFLLVLLVITVLVLACGASAMAKKASVDLHVDVAVDQAAQTEDINDQQSKNLVFNLKRLTAKPVSGRIEMTCPTALYPNGKMESFNFDLLKQDATKVVARVVFPEASPFGNYNFPIRVFVKGKKYLDMDLLVTKSIGWYYIGPFEGGPETAHDSAFEPERKLDIKATCKDLAGNQLTWKPFPTQSILPDGMYQFSSIFPGLAYATAYATTTVHADRETKARLLIGSDDSVKIWQNGKLIHNNNAIRGSVPGEDKIDVTLAEGKNIFLIKVCQGDGDWGFHFDIDDGSGKPVHGLKHDVVVSRHFITDPVLRLTNVSRTGASINWKSDVPTTSKTIVRPALSGRAIPVNGKTPKSEMVRPAVGVTPTIYEDNAYTCDHQFSFEGLEPGTRYLVSVTPAVGGKESEPLSFYTAAPAGKTMYIRQKVANLIFTNVCTKRDADRSGANGLVSQAEIERVKKECEQATMFYWINSGMRFWMDNEYYIVNRHYTIDDDTLYGVGYHEGEPDEAALKEVVEAAGKKVSDYDYRNFITMEKRWDDTTGKWWYPSSGGGTIGPEDYPGYGKSAWKGGGHNGFLYAHEDGHQVDSLYHCSGMPEYLFNHPQPWDGTAHMTGEHYDCNAWILWDWAGYVTEEHQGRPLLEPNKWYRYFTLRWGNVEFADDKDEDGIPDNVPEVPVDEVKWKSDPTKKDTDNDGLSDLAEAMACEWSDEGCGEFWAGPVSKHRSFPNNPDTDGDGLKDGVDPYPIYPISDKLKAKTPAFDGRVDEGEYTQRIELNDKAYVCDFFMSWDENNFYVSGKSKVAPQEMKIYLDFDNDGWYLGHDNYYMHIRPDGQYKFNPEFHVNADNTFGALLHNCAVPGKWPFWDRDGLKDNEVKFLTSQENGFSFEVAIPKNDANFVKLVPGQRMGILVGAMPQEWIKGPRKAYFLTAFEPNTLFRFELAK